ncbi:MAG TPA: hypothetical protein GXZ26_04330 [Firmicutes bacterium]|jgi:hypothetical protein|nr:hypothetical protein [Bacillota bacterium]
MNSSEERMRIMKMVEEGKISAEEGVELLKALEGPELPLQAANSPASGNNRFLRVRVEVGNEVKVNMNIPLRLVRVFSKIAGQGLKFIPEDARRELEAKGIDLAGIDLEELVKQIEEGLTDGKIIDVDIDEPGEKVKVEIYVE